MNAANPQTPSPRSKAEVDAGKGLHELREETARLRQAVQDLEAENERLVEQYSEIAYQNSNLESLYVASLRLHHTLDRAGLCVALQEISSNLIGCEEMGVFEVDRLTGVLRLVCSVGLDEGRYANTPIELGIIGQCAGKGERFVDGPRGLARLPEEEHLTACIPLRLDGQTFGVIALFRLLPQKSGYEALDHQLFELIENHAAIALHASALYAERKR